MQRSESVCAYIFINRIVSCTRCYDPKDPLCFCILFHLMALFSFHLIKHINVWNVKKKKHSHCKFWLHKITEIVLRSQERQTFHSNMTWIYLLDLYISQTLITKKYQMLGEVQLYYQIMYYAIQWYITIINEVLTQFT